MWIYAYVDGVETRQSLKTRSWEQASQIALDWNARQKPSPIGHTVTLADACAQFEVDARARCLSSSSLRKFALLCRQLLAWAETAGIRYPSQLTLSDLQAFRATWTDAPLSASKKLERLRSVCRFFHDHRWIPENYARAMRPPKVDQSPTLPFTQDEVVRLIGACDRLGVMDAMTQERTRTLLLVLRYTGLRISDATRLHADRITADGMLVVRMEKTRVPVLLPLPDFLLPKLEQCRQANGYYFCTGEASVETDTGNWRRRLRRLAKLAGVTNAHPQRMRDTFAVELLLRGVSIYDVSKLLGHSSVKITERSYAPWVQERRIRLQQIVRDAFSEPAAAPLSDQARPQKVQ